MTVRLRIKACAAIAILATLFATARSANAALMVSGRGGEYVARGAAAASAGLVLSLRITVPGVGEGFRNGTATPFIAPDGTGYAFISKHIYADLLAADPHPGFEVATGSNYLTDRGTVFTATAVYPHPTEDFAILKLGPNTLQGATTTIGRMSPGQKATVAGFGDNAFIGDTDAFRDGQARAWDMEKCTMYGTQLVLIFNSDGTQQASLPGKGLSYDSDSPIYNTAGQLTAMLLTQGGGNANYGTNGAIYLPKINSFIQSITVPEPTSLGLLTIGAAATMLRRRGARQP